MCAAAAFQATERLARHLAAPHLLATQSRALLLHTLVRLGDTTRAEDGFRLTRAMLEAKVTPRTKVLMLNFPNNPTGAVMGRADLEVKVDRVVLAGQAPIKRGSLVVLGKVARGASRRTARRTAKRSRPAGRRFSPKADVASCIGANGRCGCGPAPGWLNWKWYMVRIPAMSIGAVRFASGGD